MLVIVVTRAITQFYHQLFLKNLILKVLFCFFFQVSMTASCEMLTSDFHKLTAHNSIAVANSNLNQLAYFEWTLLNAIIDEQFHFIAYGL